MPARKPKDTADANAEAAEPKDAKSEQAEGKNDRNYADLAADLAADTRAWAEKARGELDDLLDRTTKLHAEHTPGADHGTIADGVRRIPMSADDLTRGLEALTGVAADLAARTAR